ncbi:MAG: putative kinesin motor domain protein [Streblomastix strix]|uniref:Kinesin-like protein n=1 Tax=Streblomastix strix TaxID=222440 RepID=A0A5J4WLG5_9EUKA|nr:MAG: putative kinesin motor domain protein [Streblomastix strix]
MSNVKSQSNILVYARSRPILEHEELIGGENCVFSQNNCIRLQAGRYSCDSNDNSDSCDRNDNRDNHDNQDFIFDGGVFGQNSTQVEVYNQVAQPMIDTALSGVNVSIFAYGQSSAGKTYTVLGGENEHSGLLPRIVAGIFDRIQGFGEDQQVSVVFTYVELYNEQIRDLINKNNENLIIRESIEKGIYIQGVSEHILDSTEAFLLLLHKGNENRATSANQYNQNSSRSHAIATLHITRKDTIRNDIKKSQFHLIDLAGSERVQQNANCSETLIKETVKINQSLFTLGKVIKELTKVVQNNTSNSSSNNNSKKSQSPMISPQLSLSDTFPLSTMSPQYSHNQIPSRTPSPLNSSQQTKVEQKYVKDVKNNENNGKEGNNTGTLKSSGKSNNKDSSQSSTLHSISSNNKNNTNKTTKDSNKNCNKDCLSNFVSYRDSKLTRLLKESLGGNARTSIIICISSSSTYYSESLNSLRFGKAASQHKFK